MTEKQILSMMKNLQCDRETAIETILEDERIEKMSIKEINAEMTPEQRKAQKDALKTGTRKSAPSTRERKVDETKKFLLTEFAEIIRRGGGSVTPLKTEAEMSFTYDNADFTIKLIKHRPPKP